MDAELVSTIFFALGNRYEPSPCRQDRYAGDAGKPLVFDLTIALPGINTHQLALCRPMCIQKMDFVCVEQGCKSTAVQNRAMFPTTQTLHISICTEEETYNNLCRAVSPAFRHGAERGILQPIFYAFLIS